MKAVQRFLAAAGICLAAASCAAPQTTLLTENPRGIPTHGSVTDTAFFPQKTRECGPAALASVLNQAGISVTPDQLVDEVYNPARGGTLTPALLAAFRRHGRIAYPVGDLATLLHAIQYGKPVLVLQNLGLQWIPQWHYAVAIGYDLDGQTITLHSGETRALEMPLSTFERTWARGGYWGMIALRPGELPRPVEETQYVDAVAGVERAGHPEAAAKAYRAAIRRWPKNSLAAMGLGNALYATGDRAGAADAFRAATRTDPRSADSYNNLAHVLGELGKTDAALRAAHKAIALGGPNIAIYRDTLRKLQASR